MGLLWGSMGIVWKLCNDPEMLYKDYMGLLTCSRFRISGGLGGFWKEGFAAWGL